jgi:hypothetical protein
VLVCGRCGHGLTASQTSNGRRVYRCKPEEGDGARCGNLNVSAEPAERAVRAMVLDALAGPGLAAAAAAVDDAGQAEAVAALDEVAARKAGAAGMFADRLIGRSEYLVMRERLDAAERDAADRLHAASRGSKAVLDGLDDVETLAERWDAEDVDDGWRRSLVDLLVEGIVVRPTGARRQVFDPARLAPTWRA